MQDDQITHDPNCLISLMPEWNLGIDKCTCGAGHGLRLNDVLSAAQQALAGSPAPTDEPLVQGRKAKPYPARKTPRPRSGERTYITERSINYLNHIQDQLIARLGPERSAVIDDSDIVEVGLLCLGLLLDNEAAGQFLNDWLDGVPNPFRCQKCNARIAISSKLCPVCHNQLD